MIKTRGPDLRTKFDSVFFAVFEAVKTENASQEVVGEKVSVLINKKDAKSHELWNNKQT